MRSRPARVSLCLLLLALLSGLHPASGSPSAVRRLDAASSRVDPADCGPGALPETGLQGQVPLLDQLTGRSKLGYRCGIEPAGENTISSRGMNSQIGWLDECAYVGMGGQLWQPPLGQTELDHPLRGVAVIDTSDPADPKLVRILKSPMGIEQHEAIRVNAQRRVLVTQIGGLEAQWIEIYDASDCTNPVLTARYDNGSPLFHGMAISPDGMTLYATSTFPDPLRPALHAFDISDLSDPRPIVTWDPRDESPPNLYGIHDLEISADGTRAYAGAAQRLGTFGPATPSLVILDLSEIQSRVANPRVRLVSETRTASYGHTVRFGRVNGTPYVFLSGELPFQGLPFCPWDWARIIDISDEQHPVVVSELKLEVNEIQNCARTTIDDENYSVHFNGVDDPQNTTLLFHTWYGSGLRVFDVRDPVHPKEIAYYNPPPLPETVFNDEATGLTDPGLVDPDFPRSAWGANPRWDVTPTYVRYRPETREIWFASVARGFQIVRLTADLS